VWQHGCPHKRSALHWAAYYGHPSTVDALVQARADVNAVDERKQSALHLAADRGRASVSIVGALVQARADVNAVDERKKSALHLATRWGRNDTVGALVQARADVNAVDEHKESALHLAAGLCPKRHSVTTIVGALVQAKADVNAVNKFGMTPLDLVRLQDYEDEVNLKAVLRQHGGKQTLLGAVTGAALKGHGARRCGTHQGGC